MDFTRSPSRRSRLCLGGLLLALPVVAGCGDKSVATHPVRGKVVYSDGSPVRGGTIELESKTNSTMVAIGTIAEDGTFAMDGGGAIAGVHRVAIHATDPPDPNPEDDEKPPKAIAAKFESFNLSGLEITVQPGENEQTLTVEKP